MCGICGIWNYAARTPADRSLLRRMADTMIHRGPDDSGYYHDDEAGFGLGFRRLAIIDLTPSGRQPMSNEDGSVWVTLNGEIYNFQELRAALADQGHVFKSRTDTEALVHQYEQRGPECIADLDGMFGLAIWDARRRQLTLARDRLGKKPLYYLDDGRRLLFASELKAILADPTVARRVDFDSLAEYLRVGYAGAPHTIFQGIRKLEPGHRLVHGAGRAEIHRYWDPRPAFTPAPPRSADEWGERIRATLRACVQRRLVSDVPLGVFLSGGVDSSAVAATMAALGGRPVKTFAIGFENQAFNELPFARAVAERLGAEHHEFMVKPEALADVLPRLARQFDEPFGDSSALPAHYVSKMARTQVTVCLSGDGGDETLAGYPHYRLADGPALGDRLPAFVRRELVGPLGRCLPPFARGHRFLARLAQDRDGRYTGMMQAAYETQVRALFTATTAGELRGRPIRLERVLTESLPDDYLSRMQCADLLVYLPEDILTKVDRTSMLNSLETRAPMLDPEFIGLLCSLPPELRRRNGIGKYMFRQAIRGMVPDQVLTRPKMGFSIPLSAWLGGDAQSFVGDVLAPEAIRRRGWFRPELVARLIRPAMLARPMIGHTVWFLLMLELWAREYVD